MGSNTAEERVAAYVDNPGAISEKDAEELFNSLKPLNDAGFMLGSWLGGGIETGHPGNESMRKLRWAGKDYRSIDDGDPIMVLNEKNERVWNEDWGHASLREMVFRGKTSVAMIYDIKPIFDHFRYVNEDLIMGAMDAPKVMDPSLGTFYFSLKRRKV
ncbi:MAG: hypothetical protein Q9220_007271 [cf. Caloplaca sp. 1 TL-2023]